MNSQQYLQSGIVLNRTVNTVMMSKSLTFYEHFATLSASHTSCVTNVCVVCVFVRAQAL